jgi:hypothetical protein
MKLTKRILRQLILQEMRIFEQQKYYARAEKGAKVSVFTDKDNWEDAVKNQGYDSVDSAEAEKELGQQKGEKPDAAPEKKPQSPPEQKPQPKTVDIAADPFADKDGEEPSDSPEARLAKIDSEIADIEKQRRILKQYMTSSGGGGVSRSRRDQLEKEDKKLVAKWRELQQARMDLDGPVYGDDATEEPSGELPDWHTKRTGDYEEWNHVGGIKPKSQVMSRDEMEASGIPMRELESNYDSIPKDAGDAVVDSYDGFNQKTGQPVQMVVIRYGDGTTYYMETELHHHGDAAKWPDGEEFYDNRMKKVNQRSTKPDDYQSRGMAPKESAVQKSAAIHGVFGVEPLHGHDYTKPPKRKKESVTSQLKREFKEYDKLNRNLRKL